jgi:hypothetical protein
MVPFLFAGCTIAASPEAPMSISSPLSEVCRAPALDIRVFGIVSFFIEIAEWVPFCATCSLPEEGITPFGNTVATKRP